MDKRTALQVLIKHSFLISDKIKSTLISKIPSLNDEQIEVLGKLLAKEKQLSLKAANKKIKEMDRIINKLDNLAHKK
jgi:hypothetical protein